MKRRSTRRILTGVFLAVLLGLPAASLGETAAVEKGSIRKTVFGSGDIQPASQPGAYAEITAEVSEIYVSVGDAVKKGDIVAQLKNDELAAEAAQLEHDLQIVQKDVLFTEDHKQYEYRPLYDEEGNVRLDANTQEILKGLYSNEISIRAPGSGRIMALYLEAGDDALAEYREHGCVAMISTDGRMKVELEGVEGIKLEYDQVVNVRGEGIDTQGRIISLTRYGTNVTVQIIGDEYPMDAPVTVTTLEGDLIGEGVLAINKPLAVSAYGGTVKGVYSYIKVGSTIKRGDVIARIHWDEIPLYIENDLVLREYAKMLTQLETAWKKLDDLAVVAPCDGVVASVDVEENDSVEDGTKLLSVVDRSAGMELAIAIDELDIVHVRPGQTVSVTVDALPGVALEGEVLKIAPLGNTESSVTTYDVYIQLRGEIDERIRGGMNASGEIEIESADDALLIPTDALVKGDNGWQVQTADGNHVDVTVGIMTDSRTQILSGLYEGETVVY